MKYCTVDIGCVVLCVCSTYAPCPADLDIYVNVANANFSPHCQNCSELQLNSHYVWLTEAFCDLSVTLNSHYFIMLCSNAILVWTHSPPGVMASHDHSGALVPSVFIRWFITSDILWCFSAPGRSETSVCGRHRRWSCSIQSEGWSQCWSELLRRPEWLSSWRHHMTTGSTTPLRRCTHAGTRSEKQARQPPVMSAVMWR